MFSKDPAKAQRSRISGIMRGSHTDCGSATLLTHEPLITSELPSLRIQHITGFLKHN
jgi:hypothetical protein